MNTSIFPKFSLQSTHGTYYDDNVWSSNLCLLESNDFYSKVVNRVGTRSPFIFLPDSTNMSADSWAIAKFDGPFRYRQESNNVMAITLKIKEVW